MGHRGVPGHGVGDAADQHEAELRRPHRLPRRPAVGRQGHAPARPAPRPRSRSVEMLADGLGALPHERRRDQPEGHGESGDQDPAGPPVVVLEDPRVRRRDEPAHETAHREDRGDDPRPSPEKPVLSQGLRRHRGGEPDADAPQHREPHVAVERGLRPGQQEQPRRGDAEPRRHHPSQPEAGDRQAHEQAHALVEGVEQPEDAADGGAVDGEIGGDARREDAPAVVRRRHPEPVAHAGHEQDDPTVEEAGRHGAPGPGIAALRLPLPPNRPLGRPRRSTPQTPGRGRG